jgi:hypothetical protein
LLKEHFNTHSSPVFISGLCLSKIKREPGILINHPIADRCYRIYIAVLVGLFIGSLIIRKGQDVLFINGLHTPLPDDLFRTITNLGDGIIFISIIIVTLFILLRYTVIKHGNDPFSFLIHPPSYTRVLRFIQKINRNTPYVAVYTTTASTATIKPFCIAL